jgi:citrate synthase
MTEDRPTLEGRVAMTRPIQPAERPGTAISTSDVDRINVRGFDLAEDLIGHVSFGEFFAILLLGERPSPALARLLDACLVAIAEHGLTPSVQAARMTYSAASDALQGAVAAGLLGCGTTVLGASEDAGRLLSAIVARARAGEHQDTVTIELLQEMKRTRRALPGFGHRQHKNGDPRALRLLALARELGTSGAHVAALDAVARLHPGVLERCLPLNATGAIAAVLLGAGFPGEVLKGIPLVARAAGIVAHLLEESRRPIAFRMVDLAAAHVPYEGHALARDLEASQ